MVGVGVKEWLFLMVLVGLLAVGVEHGCGYVARRVHVTFGVQP